MAGFKYEYISGKRQNSELLYVVDQKQLYRKKFKYHSYLSYICYQDGCNSRMDMRPDGVCVQPKRFIEHLHTDQEALYNELKLINKIKRDITKPENLFSPVSVISGIRSVFQSACATEGISSNLNMKKMERNLRKITTKNVQYSPETMKDVLDVFQNEVMFNEFGKTKHNEPKIFFKAGIEEDKFSYCIFSSDEIINQINENIEIKERQYLMDATFNIYPMACFKQFLTIYIEYKEQVFPFIFILLSNKTEACYSHLFKYINENVFRFEAKTFIMDYECGMRAAMKKLYPDAIYLNSWFHYCQAIRRKCAQSGRFFNNIKQNDITLKLYHKILVLPLLPAESIKSAFEMIKNEINLFGETEFLRKFIKYFDREWINGETVNNISIFKQPKRTICAIEIYNGYLSRSFPKNGNFFKFIKVLRNEEFNKSTEFKMIIKDDVNLIKNKKYDHQVAKIFEATLLLETKKISITEFLNRMIDPQNQICTEIEKFYKPPGYSDDGNDYRKDHVDDDDDDDEATVFKKFGLNKKDNLCALCQDIRSDIRHIQVCTGCSSKLIEPSFIDKMADNHTIWRTIMDRNIKAAAVQQTQWQHGEEPSATTTTTSATNPNPYEVIKEEYDVTEQNVDEFQEIATVQGAEEIFKVYEPTLNINYKSGIKTDGGESSSSQQLQHQQQLMLPSTSAIKDEPEYISSDDSMSFDGEASSSIHFGSVSGSGAGRRDDDFSDTIVSSIPPKSLSSKLAIWALNSGLSTRSIEQLLEILREEKIDVPATVTELMAFNNITSTTTIKKPVEVKPPENVEPVSPVISALQEENKYLMKEIKNIQKTVIDGQEKTIGVLKAEIQELNFGMKKIFKLLKENDITESTPPEFAKTFPIRTQNELHAIEVKAISNNDYAERLTTCLQNMVSKLEPDKKTPFRKVFHDSLLNDSTWDGIHGLGSYRFCNSILYEAWKSPSLGMEDYVNRFKKEIAKRKLDLQTPYVEPKKLKI